MVFSQNSSTSFHTSSFPVSFSISCLIPWYVFAVTSDNNVDGLFNLGCYKVDYENLNSAWLNVSNPLLVPGNANGAVPPRFNLLDNKVVGFYPSGKENNRDGFYYYRSDPNVREVIGLSWNGNLYREAVN